jgi:hypothetical protein
MDSSGLAAPGEMMAIVTLPFEELGFACGQAVHQLLAQHEREEGAEHVTTDTGIGFVEDRPRCHQRLGRLESDMTSSRLPTR